MKPSGKTAVLVIDVGGTKIAAAFVSLRKEILRREQISTPQTGARDSVKAIARWIVSLLGGAAGKNLSVRAIGICVPGICFAQQGKVWAPHIKGWNHIPLKKMLEQEWKRAIVENVQKDSPRVRGGAKQKSPRKPFQQLPIFVLSDREAYVTGEAWCGAAQGMTDVVFLALGTGIGAGILSDGRVVHGHEDIAGAVGWFALTPAQTEIHQKLGCFEAEAAGPALARRARELLAEHTASRVYEMVNGDAEKITSEIVLQASAENDLFANRVINETLQYLAMGLANLVSAFNPQAIVLGGGFGGALKPWLPTLRVMMQEWAQPIAMKKVQLKISSLHENAGLFGAARVAWTALRS